MAKTEECYSLFIEFHNGSPLTLKRNTLEEIKEVCKKCKNNYEGNIFSMQVSKIKHVGYIDCDDLNIGKLFR